MFSSISAVQLWLRTFPYWRSKSSDKYIWGGGCGEMGDGVGSESDDGYCDVVRPGVDRSGRQTSRLATSSPPSTAG